MIKEEEAVLWSDFLGFILTKIKKKGMKREKENWLGIVKSMDPTLFQIFIKVLLNNVI